jgi:RNA recognition motif-containing protein
MTAPSFVTEAIDKLNGTTFMDRILRLDQATEAGQHNCLSADINKRSVFIGQLPFSATEEEIAEIFKDCGKIHHVRIPRDPEGKSRGIAYITFDTQEAVDLALKFNKAQFGKQTITVQSSNPGKAEKMKKKEIEGKKPGRKFSAKAKGDEQKLGPKKRKNEKDDGRGQNWEGKRARGHEHDKNQSKKTFLKMKAHVRKKRSKSVGK